MTNAAAKYDGSKRRRPGRRTKPEVAALVVRMAEDNPKWGYTRIRDGMRLLGHTIGRNTVKRILLDHGIDPAPERGERTPWKTFLKAHWDGLAAADFFTVEIVTVRGLVRYYVFFIMRLKTRSVEIAGIVCQPTGDWMKPIARNLTDAEAGFCIGVTHLLLDRDPLYTAQVRGLLGDAGVDGELIAANTQVAGPAEAAVSAVQGSVGCSTSTTERQRRPVSATISSRLTDGTGPGSWS